MLLNEMLIFEVKFILHVLLQQLKQWKSKNITLLSVSTEYWLDCNVTEAPVKSLPENIRRVTGIIFLHASLLFGSGSRYVGNHILQADNNATF